MERHNCKFTYVAQSIHNPSTPSFLAFLHPTAPPHSLITSPLLFYTLLTACRSSIHSTGRRTGRKHQRRKFRVIYGRRESLHQRYDERHFPTRCSRRFARSGYVFMRYMQREQLRTSSSNFSALCGLSCYHFHSWSTRFFMKDDLRCICCCLELVKADPSHLLVL